MNQRLNSILNFSVSLSIMMDRVTFFVPILLLFLNEIRNLETNIELMSYSNHKFSEWQEFTDYLHLMDFIPENFIKFSKFGKISRIRFISKFVFNSIIQNLFWFYDVSVWKWTFLPIDALRDFIQYPLFIDSTLYLIQRIYICTNI